MRNNLALGRTADALADANAAVNLAPRASFVYRSRAFVFMSIGQYDNALKDFNTAQQIDPQDTGLLFDRGRLYAQMGNYKSAIDDFTADYLRDPNNTLALRERASAYFEVGNLKQAVADIETFLAALPEDQTGVELRAKIQKSIGASWSVQQQAIIPNIHKTERRIALVIGNSAYLSVDKLVNPVRDAGSIAETLKGLGFQTVQVGVDLNKYDFMNALHSFSKEAESADWAIVYFSGHGLQLGGVNYLIPIDSQIDSERDVPFEAIAVDDVLLSVEAAKLLKVVILDACRNNPFITRMSKKNLTKSLEKGLVPVEPETGTLVVYAAKHGHTASDGEAFGHSPFAQALLRNITKPNIEIRKLFDLVRDDVMEATANRQQPFTYGSLSGHHDYYFSLGAQ